MNNKKLLEISRTLSALYEADHYSEQDMIRQIIIQLQELIIAMTKRKGK